MLVCSPVAIALWLGLLARTAHCSARSKSQFLSWYPQFGTVIENILKNDCFKQYDDYLYGTTTNVTIDTQRGGDENTLFVQPVVQCILSGTSEFIKSDLSSAQVILGLTPTILALLGASSEETALLAVIGKRPFLTMLLSIASPSVYTSRAFEYRNPREILRDREGRLRPTGAAGGARPRWRRLLLGSGAKLAGQYLFAFAALGNVALINWDLSRSTIVSISAEFRYMPACWAAMVVLIHVWGIVLLRLRARRTTRRGRQEEAGAATAGAAGRISSWLRRFGRKAKEAPRMELSLLVDQDGGVAYAEWFDETRLFITGAWLHSMLTVTHIVFGTLVFSSILFVGPRDAIQVFGRYMFSALGCRVVLMYELAGLRESYNAGLAQEALKHDHRACEHRVDCHGCGGRRERPPSKGAGDDDDDYYGLYSLSAVNTLTVQVSPATKVITRERYPTPPV